MYNVKDFTLLRSWQLERDSGITIDDVGSVFNDMIEAIDACAYIKQYEIEGAVALKICNDSNLKYMPVYVYMSSNNSVEMALEGKGEQIKAKDLEKLYYKAAGVLDGIGAGYKTSRNFMQRFGVGNTTSAITAGLSVATGAAIGGSIRLVAKGVKALLRDQAAYDKEMSFYTLVMSFGDYLIGAFDNNNLIAKLKENGEKGKVAAQYLLGCAYEEGRGIEANHIESVKWFGLAAENGEVRSKEIIACEYLFSANEYSLEKKERGIEYLAEIADSGEAWAMEALLQIYGQGIVKDIPADIPKTVDLAEKYSEAGNLYAIMLIAEICDSSLNNGGYESNICKDDVKAASLYEKIIWAEPSEHTGEAAWRLANMLREGRGVSKNIDEAIIFYKRASNAGNLEAKAELALLYTFGSWVEKNHSFAQKLCDEIIKSQDTDVIPIAYYCNHIIADEAKRYGQSIKYAEHYIECENIDSTKKAALKRYIEEQEELICKMSDKERKIYLNEPKEKLFFLDMGLGKKRGVLIIAVMVIALVSFLIIQNANNSSITDTEDMPTFYQGTEQDIVYNQSTYEGYESDFIFPGSDTYYLTEAELIYLTEDDIQRAINEIYARHGRIFKEEPYASLFRSCSWYIPMYEADDFDTACFNSYENKNIQLLAAYRDKYFGNN